MSAFSHMRGGLHLQLPATYTVSSLLHVRESLLLKSGALNQMHNLFIKSGNSSSNRYSPNKNMNRFDFRSLFFFLKKTPQNGEGNDSSTSDLTDFLLSNRLRTQKPSVVFKKRTPLLRPFYRPAWVTQGMSSNQLALAWTVSINRWRAALSGVRLRKKHHTRTRRRLVIHPVQKLFCRANRFYVTITLS